MTGVLQKANDLINGDRMETYGDPVELWSKVSKVVSAMLNRDVSPEECVMIMVAVKIVRQGYKAKEDNLVDAAAYLEILSKFSNKVSDDKKTIIDDIGLIYNTVKKENNSKYYDPILYIKYDINENLLQASSNIYSVYEKNNSSSEPIKLYSGEINDCYHFIKEYNLKS